MGFPKNIFQVWFQGCSKVSKQVYAENMKSWMMLNPSWKYSCISDKELRQACAKFSSEALATYDAFDAMHLKIDFGRYVVLYLYGGIYVDMDAYALRSLDTSKDVVDIMSQYNEHTHILGLSTLNLAYSEALIMVGHTTMINNAIMISSPQNPILKTFIEKIIDRAKTIKYNVKWVKISHTTGPNFLNQFVWPYIANPPHNVVIKLFSNDIFEPCLIPNCNITDNTISIHSMEITWFPTYLKYLRDLYQYLKLYSTYILFFIIIILIIWYRRRLYLCGKKFTKGKK